MNPLQRLVEQWRFRGQGGMRQVILLEISGLELRHVDQYLADGLLHNLALMSDVGTRLVLPDLACDIVESLSMAARERKFRVSKLEPRGKLVADLVGICRDDELQQTQLMERLERWWSGLLVSTFDMPARLRRLFGPNAGHDEQLVLRDVYARMDEIVGKVYSFVDEFTVLVVVIESEGGPTGPESPRETLIFCSRSHVLRGETLHDFAVDLFESSSTTANWT